MEQTINLPVKGTNMSNICEEYAEAFTIFSKYLNSDVTAEHDKIWAGPRPSEVSEEDKSRLTELRWYADEKFDCFYRFT